MAFIRLVAALIGFVFGFFLGANLLQVTQVTPANNQVLVVLLLATACAILGWLGAPYVTVMPAAIVVERIRLASAGDLIGGALRERQHGSLPREHTPPAALTLSPRED